MGGLSSIFVPDFIMFSSLEYKVLEAKVEKYNNFYKKANEHIKEVIEQDREINNLLMELLDDTKSEESLEIKLAESMIILVFHILHYARIHKNQDLEFKFSNYIPGIMLNAEILEDERIKEKYFKFYTLCTILPDVLAKLTKLSELIISDVEMAYNKIPKAFFLIAKDHNQIKMLDFVSLENIWLDNNAILIGFSRNIDTIFKNIGSLIIIANKTISMCNEKFDEITRILNSVDEWNSDTLPKSIQDWIQRFIKDNIN